MTIRELAALVRRAVAKPPAVVGFRLRQELELAALRLTGGWGRIERRAAQFCSLERIRELARRSSSATLLAPDALEALETAFEREWLDRDSTIAVARRIAKRNFDILSVPIPAGGPFPWHEDWRFGHRWAPAYFKTFEFYEPRTVPYDVKYPWELARLGFLLPLLQGAAVARDRTLVSAAVAVMNDFTVCNPIAWSVNWYPMEASMRAVNIAICADMLSISGLATAEDLQPFLSSLAQHGEFIARTIEYSDVRGNHYAANLIALLIAGLRLEGLYPPAAAWVHTVSRVLSAEISAQLLPDGVDFEKAFGYHRLVGELFLLGQISCTRRGLELSEEASRRIRLSGRFTSAYMRPDGTAPVIGDSDDARVLAFDDWAPASHAAFAATAAAWFGDEEARPADGRVSCAIPWLTGMRGLERYIRLPARTREVWHFADGGFFIARRHANQFVADFGEVGLGGRGGHGHNDLFSFELLVEGVPFVVDAGTYMYTGDLAARRWFQSTEAHNTLRIDAEEIAPIRGVWRIDAAASPRDVAVESDGATARIRGAHEGYGRLADPVSHSRTCRFDLTAGRLHCADVVTAARHHKVERFLHFGAGADVLLRDGGALVSIHGIERSVRWDEGSSGRLDRGWVSGAYGHRETAPVLVIHTETAGEWQGWLEIG